MVVKLARIIWGVGKSVRNECLDQKLARCGLSSTLACAVLAIGLSTHAEERSFQSESRGRLTKQMRSIEDFNTKTLRLAIEDLRDTYGTEYRDYDAFIAELERLELRKLDLETASDSKSPPAIQDVMSLNRGLTTLRRRALLANPALKDLDVICVRRAWASKVFPTDLRPLGIPSNHECHSSLSNLGYDNEIVVFDIQDPLTSWETIYEPNDSGWVGHVDLHWDAEHLLFARADADQWKLWEIALNDGMVRQVSIAPPGVDCFDPCYLPGGKIICGSNATGQCVPCWHGIDEKYVANLFLMNRDGSDMRRISFDQDHNTHPAVMSNGRIVYNRWDYTGMNRIFTRPLMEMYPDGTGQRSLYGSNSWYPNGLYFPRELPGRNGQLLCVLSGYHGPGRTGDLVIIDTNRSQSEESGIVQKISGLGLPVEVKTMDALTVETWPKFHSPQPITDKQFLVSMWRSRADDRIGIYLADVFDNLVLVHEIEGEALLEPTPVKSRTQPPVIPDRVDPDSTEATVYLHNVYLGQGLRDVPDSTIKSLRVVAYHFGYIGLAGCDKIGLSGPWDAMRILGTTPVHDDGSAHFKIPANTPVAFQALDREGKAVQLMRSWTSARPGERVSCIGCHEHPSETPPGNLTYAATGPARDLDPWYGPPRGFDFEREVQPVLNRYCVSCHDGQKFQPDLRAESDIDHYQGRVPGRLDSQRMHPDHKQLYDGHVKYTPAYEALLTYIRRVNIGDDVSLLVPGFYHADTSELIQLLKKGHHGIELDKESWDRLVTWIDLNGPCHGTWGDVFDVPIPGASDQRRRELFKWFGGPPDDPEFIPEASSYDESPVTIAEQTTPDLIEISGWPFDGRRTQQRVAAAPHRSIDLGNGVEIPLVLIPAGSFVMGDVAGQPDEYPVAEVEIKESFWMSQCEISNQQLRQFLPSHSSGYYSKRHADRSDDKGMRFDGPRQPALKLSWNDAMEFCRRVSMQTGWNVTLPTEAQWEYACRAGTDTPFFYGSVEDQFGAFENMADRTFATVGFRGKSLAGYFQVGGDVDYIDAEGVQLADRRSDDGACMTAEVGGYLPNAFGLKDMHGNVAEWTLSTYREYPYVDEDGRNSSSEAGLNRVVRGGSFLDRPERCRSAIRHGFPAWQKVHHVGFRIVIDVESINPDR